MLDVGVAVFVLGSGNQHEEDVLGVRNYKLHVGRYNRHTDRISKLLFVDSPTSVDVNIHYDWVIAADCGFRLFLTVRCEMRGKPI